MSADLRTIARLAGVPVRQLALRAKVDAHTADLAMRDAVMDVRDLATELDLHLSGVDVTVEYFPGNVMQGSWIATAIGVMADDEEPVEL